MVNLAEYNRLKVIFESTSGYAERIYWHGYFATRFEPAFGNIRHDGHPSYEMGRKDGLGDKLALDEGF
jgi:hypothetical protein